MRRTWLYWGLWAGILLALAYAGHLKLHVREFVLFLGLLFLLSIVTVGVLLGTYRKGEPITREPFGE